MATGEQPSPLKSKKISTSSTRSRNDSDPQWLLLPNNLELGARAKPSKKQRNKEKHRHFQKENVSSSSEVADGVSSKTGSFRNFPQVKCNTATWLKDQFSNEKKSKRRAYDSEEVFSDSDLPHLQNVNYPANQTFADLEHQERLPPSTWGVVENDNIKSVKDELKKKETAIVCEILSHIQEFISEAESSWQKLDLSDEPIIKDAFMKLKNAVKDVEGGRENKPILHHTISESGFPNGVSPSSSTSRISNSKENIVNRDASGNIILCNEDDQTKCNQLQELKVSEERTESLSSDEFPIVDVGERVAAVEWERRKLKNKLVELKEEKKMKDELLRELYFLKDAANTATGSSQLQKTKDKKKKKLCKSQPSQRPKMITNEISAEDNQNMILEPSDIPVSHLGPKQSRSSTSVKRDNVRKEQNSAFPARRHYEAEGRANEDPDIPVAAAAAAAIPSLSPVLDNPEIQDKIKKLKLAQQHVKVIKDIIVSILETRKAGSLIPIEQLRLLSPIQKADQCFSDTDSQDEFFDELPQAVHSRTPDAMVCFDGSKTMLVDAHSQKPLEQQQFPATASNLETVVGKKSDIVKLHSQFQQLMQIFPSSDKIEDPVRSSGEGAYTQKKNPSNVVPENIKKTSSLRTVPLQDNLQLTRQNIVTVELQNQNTNSNLHNRDCNSVKKDNINNLSGKMGKLSLQNTMNSSYPDVLTGSNNNMDTMSTFSYELNQNHSLSNEVERKTILDILKKDKKKQKQYDRNQDSKMCCNSSVDSEPLEGSNSALAVDAPTVAAWGGSSTQDNFDEEHAESLEDHDDFGEDHDDFGESASVFDKGSINGHKSSQYSAQFSNMQHYIDSVTNIPEKRQRNFHQPLYNRNQNQPVLPSGYQQHPTQVPRPTRRPIPSPNTTGLASDLQDTSCAADAPEHCHQHPSKFIQQLKNHVDQLNVLCQNQMFHDRSQPVNCPQTQNLRFTNTCTPLQPVPEMVPPYNQQMLLSLSQCYHALYMQQLEIQHLQRCMLHNIDAENAHQLNNQNSRTNEDSTFRPYSMPSWPNPFVPSSHFPPDQISPMSSMPYFNLPMKPYSNHSGGTYASVSGTPPARAVIHPTSQNNTASQETLNNQVPPRTRANNFWDNFRSYSRQNLLSSTNNAKRNENVSSFVAPQVRQVYPLVSNESPSRLAEASNACCNTTSFSEYNRSTQNPDVPDANIPKRAKANMPFAATGSNRFHKKDLPAGIAYSGFQNVRASRCHRPKMEMSVLQPISNPSSNNLIQLQPDQDSSKVGSFSSICPTSMPQASADANASTTSEIPCVSSDKNQSDFLMGLFREANSLKSEVLHQKALRFMRDLVMSEKHDSDENTQVKVQNDQFLTTNKMDSNTLTVLNQSCTKQASETVVPSEITDSEKMQMFSDNASGNIQNLPTAAIPPLNKPGTPKTISTGAVRKKPKVLSACFTDPTSNVSASHESGGSSADNADPSTVLPQNKTLEDIPGFVTNKVLADLASMLPSLKRRLLRDGCSQTFWTFINDCLIESLRTHLFFFNISLSHKSLFHLRQTVYLFLSLFSGIALSDFDSDFLKYVEEFIYENMTCFIASGQFAPVPSSLDEENCSMEIEDKMQELCVKMPVEHTEHMKELSIKMPSEASDTFSTQCGTTQQNLLQSLCYDSFIPEPSIDPDCINASAEDIGCGCNPEAEIEPEVEIGTEADLAEADQSPGQQGTINDSLPTTENWCSDQEAVLNRNVNNATAVILNGGDNRDVEDSSESATGTQLFSDACLDEEAILDDIPIKLCPSEEELPQQLKDELPTQLPSDDINSHSEFASESSGDGNSTNLR